MQPVPPKKETPVAIPPANAKIREYITNIYYNGNMVGQRTVWAKSPEQATLFQKNMLTQDPAFGSKGGWLPQGFRVEILGETGR